MIGKRHTVLVIPNGFEANFTLGLVRGLAANGLDLDVLACDVTAPRLAEGGIRHQNVRGSTRDDRPSLTKIYGLLRYYARTLHAVFRARGSTMHFCGIFRNERILFEGVILHLWIRLWTRRYLYTVHNVLPHSRAHSSFFRAIYRWIYRWPDVLLVHTRGSFDQLVDEFGVPPERVRLTSIGLNEEMPSTDLTPATARERLGYDQDVEIILFFGKIDEYKGLDILIEAFAALARPDSRLIIAGTFRSAEWRDKILAEIENSPRRGDIWFDNRFVPNSEAEIYFKAADVLCLPYRHIYQSGLAFLAPRFGLPVVSTDVGELREFSEGGFGLVSKTNDASGVSRALEEFFASPERFSRSAIMASAQFLRWDRICATLVPYYSEDLSRARSTGRDPAASHHS